MPSKNINGRAFVFVGKITRLNRKSASPGLSAFTRVWRLWNFSLVMTQYLIGRSNSDQVLPGCAAAEMAAYPFFFPLAIEGSFLYIINRSYQTKSGRPIP